MNADRRPLTRRQFVRLGALLGLAMGGGVLAACAPAAPAQPTAAAAKPTAPPAAPAAPTSAPAVAAKPTTAPAGQAAPVGNLTIAQGVDAESMDPYVTTSGASKGMLWTV